MLAWVSRLYALFDRRFGPVQLSDDIEVQKNFVLWKGYFYQMKSKFNNLSKEYMVNVDIYNETHDWKIVSGAPCNEDDANNIMPQRLVMIF